MSKVFNMVGGGGGKNISSIIITGLESTDTVTCTKDGKSYTATWDETAKHWEIVGLPLGTFTVSATNETKTITETVLIDIAGVYEIEMVMKVWLYNGDDSGNEFTNLTGGWGISGYSQSGWTIKAGKKETNCLNMTATDTSYFLLATLNGIDLTNYTKLCADSYQSNSGTLAFGITTSKTNYYTTEVIGMGASVGNRGIKSLDITDLTGIHFIALRNGSANLGWIGKAYRIWLE